MILLCNVLFSYLVLDLEDFITPLGAICHAVS